MKYRWVVTFILLFVLHAAWAANAQPKVEYKHYVNVRFGYEIKYPDGLLAPQGEADNGDGQSFQSNEHDVSMTVWGSNNIFEETLESRFGSQPKINSKECYNPKIMYSRRGNNWFVVSGTCEDVIFYEKNIIYIDGSILVFHIEYPSGKKYVWDSIVSDMSKSFKYFNGPVKK